MGGGDGYKNDVWKWRSSLDDDSLHEDCNHGHILYIHHILGNKYTHEGVFFLVCKGGGALIVDPQKYSSLRNSWYKTHIDDFYVILFCFSLLDDQIV